MTAAALNDPVIKARIETINHYLTAESSHQNYLDFVNEHIAHTVELIKERINGR